MKTLLPALFAVAVIALPTTPLHAQASEKEQAAKAEKATDEDLEKAANDVQATPAGTFSTVKRTVDKDGNVTTHDTSKKLEVTYKDHGDAGAKQDEVEQQQLIDKMREAQVKKEGGLPQPEGDIPTAQPVAEAGETGAAAAEGGVKVAKAVAVQPGDERNQGAEVTVQQGNTAQKVQLTGEQKRTLEEQLRQKEATEEELRQQRKILDKTPETDKMKNPTLKKRGSFTR
ncbi:MAG: hypothetical protein AAGK14_08435 [Verrucomicrobiota bacterium]